MPNHFPSQLGFSPRRCPRRRLQVSVGGCVCVAWAQRWASAARWCLQIIPRGLLLEAPSSLRPSHRLMAWWLNSDTESSLIIKAENRRRKFLQSHRKANRKQSSPAAVRAASPWSLASTWSEAPWVPALVLALQSHRQPQNGAQPSTRAQRWLCCCCFLHSGWNKGSSLV